MNRVQMGWRKQRWILLLLAMVATPVLAQTANFGSLTLGAEQTSGTLTGSTGGSTSLPAIVSNRDRRNQKCLGFGDPSPDHLLMLQQDFPKLQLQVHSKGADTTLVIRGSDGVVRCGDDTDVNNKNASVVDTNWQSGTYEIWVGTTTPSVRTNYTLSIRP